ncbi:MAG: preprotein translocase subunit SecG [Halobacteriovoraceae bacterium]|nr:preprotein translocase subunit SecG [Halobacteriovoraceae bacterium]|tara:strand:- start:9691 stop:10143 length:453 start_codon:yes stop_codon:yes gene_type:complete
MLSGLIIFHVVVCILLTIVVLLQFGKGAEAGAMMGSGSSQAIFTTNSKGNFFTKMTTALAVLFMVNSVVLSTLTTKESDKSILDDETPVTTPLNSDSPADAAEEASDEMFDGTPDTTGDGAPIEENLEDGVDDSAVEDSTMVDEPNSADQ